MKTSKQTIKIKQANSQAEELTNQASKGEKKPKHEPKANLTKTARKYNRQKKKKKKNPIQK